MATIRQKKALTKIKKLVESGRKISVSKIMRESGFSPETAKVPGKLTKSKAGKEFLDRLKEIRDKSLEALTDGKIAGAKYDKLVDGVEKITKVVELLEGRETERNKVIIVDL